jgi:general stress protein 26
MASTKKRDQLRALMEGIDIAMFTTLGEDGFPVSRPLSTQDAEFDGEVLWFFVRRDTPKVDEIARYPRVNVAYASKDRNVYLSVAGIAEVVDDQAKIDELWSDALKAYFKRGRTDPNLVLIRVAVHTVQYWEGPSTGLGKLIAFVAARLGADESVMGENRLLRLEEAPSRQRRAARKKAVSAGRRRGRGRSGEGDTTSAGRGGTGAAKAASKKKAASGRATAKKATTRATPKKGTKKAASKKSASTKSASKRASPRRSSNRTPR